jgi:hypothetical protein
MNGPTLLLVAAIGTIVAVALAPILKNYGAPVPVVL